jgi:hypothetical protein
MTSLATTISNKKKPEANLAVNPGLCCLEFDVRDVEVADALCLGLAFLTAQAPALGMVSRLVGVVNDLPISACGCLVAQRDLSAPVALALAIVTVLLVGVVNELPTGRGVVFVSHGRLRAVTDSNLLSCLHLHSK